jgi:DNA-binding FadR family transcriptional regulator
MTTRNPSVALDVVAGLIELSDSAEDGTRLGQKDSLRRHFDVSVGAFNEALKVAQDRGVIQVRRGPGGGIFSAKQTAMGRLAGELMTLDAEDASIADIWRMRNSLDPLMISDAIDHATMADIQELRQNVARQDACILAGDVAEFIRLGMDYQRVLLAVSPNTMLRPVFGTLLDILEREAVPVSTAGGGVTPEGMKARLEFFVRMTDALESRNREEAFSVMIESTVGWRPYLQPDPKR